MDDYPSVRYYHTYVLGKAGFRCEVARNGCEALEKLSEVPVDLVMLDIVMPNMNGLEVIRQIRGDPVFARLPVLVISTEPLAEEVRRAPTADAGPVGFAQKPLVPDVVIAEVRRLLEQDPVSPEAEARMAQIGAGRG